MKKKYNYAILGRNWGVKINNILKGMHRNSFVINLDYKSLKINEYFEELKKIIYENNIDIIWLAIPPDNHYKICKFIIDCKVNIILEKPVVFNYYQKKILKNLLIKNNLFLSVHFEYIFLKDLLTFDQNLKFDKVKYVFNHSNKKKNISTSLDLGIHMIAIKKMYFNDINNYQLKTNFNSENKRQIIFILNKIIVHKVDFTNSAQKIIQQFITYYEKEVMGNIENKLDLDFAFSVYKELLKKINKKKRISL
tara:strand:+ start:426 stop:1178 length:753 start_codon:yes stop_codon:yes gene_type:complete